MTVKVNIKMYPDPRYPPSQKLYVNVTNSIRFICPGNTYIDPWTKAKGATDVTITLIDGQDCAKTHQQ
ncbi:hypothetical protein HDU79_007962, partial [Rhizoclosmatium sp. JEL0117]